MPASLSTVDKITKEIYQGKIRAQLSEESVGYKRIEKTNEGVTNEVGGKYVTFPIRVRRNHGIGYRNEMELLPSAGQQGYASVRVGLKYGYGRVRLTGQLIELADSNYQAFASAMQLEMDGLKTDIGKDTNRVFYGDGLGTLATVTAATVGTNTAVVNSVRFLEVGVQIDIQTGATATVRVANRQVTAVNSATKTITFDGAVASLAVGDLIVRTGNFGREPNGLASLVTDTGTLFNVDPNVEPVWKAVVRSNAGTNRALSEGLMIEATDAVRVNGGKTSLILCGLGVRRAYFNLLSQQRRYPSTTTFEGGFTGLAFNNGREIPVVEDPDAPDSTMYGLDEDSLKIYRNEAWSWMNRDGGIWKWVHDFDAYEAIMNQYWEIGLNRRNANFVIKDLVEG
jgi:hypothetical protein